ncbi:MAG: cation:proton antiporter [Chloroflexi bacterium]|nr:cation:proton antiporter [Chloroflexota bacterium]MCI0575430.1 cation:proton antiporter [Chloroflexota bacterium]MCI0649888.1 cation:proton antiporter [Chloroflexota bacterium]MCI0725658.1 cation:proton antiporter [Chloroflexota bacterium]
MFEWLQQLTPPTNVIGPALIAYVLLDIFLIVVLARLLGSLMVKIKQPRVVGEILAGVLLGPTLLGDNLSRVIAPTEARPVLGVIATIALALFMFLAGVEYDMSRVKGRAGQAGLLAVLAVAVPAVLGFPVAQLVHTPVYYGPAGETLLPFALFIGAALSVTAFPVMAHILMERGELNSPMGSLGVAATGIMSVLMFLYIAFAGTVAVAQGFGDFILRIVWIVVFAVVSWFVVRPWLARTLPGMMKGEALTGNGMAICFAGLVLYALIGHLVGINALVGGFAWGLILPPDPAMRRSIAGKVNDVAMVFLLPIFFALAGFQTDLKLLTLETLPATLLVLAAAIGGKFIAAASVKLFGLSWREVGIIGALINTRGLLVLVAGLIGLEMNIITNVTFTIIVVVALVTNLMTLPILNMVSQAQVPAPAKA